KLTDGDMQEGGSVSVNTDPAGEASVSISSTNAGPALITASAAGGVMTTRAIEFVATQAHTLTLQAEPFTVRAGEQSAITAIVRDVNNNLVKNKAVSFQIVDDTTGSSLTVPQSITNSQGSATTFFVAGSVASGV